MLIEAAARLVRSGHLSIDFVGDGPERIRLEEQVDREKITDGVLFHGQIAHTEVSRWMGGSDLLVLPSVREFGGGVVLEAMAVGLPALVVDYAGPAELVSSSTGFRIALAPREQLVASLRSALEALVANPERIDACSGPARERVERYFTWDRKAEQVLSIYDWVLDRSARPDFPRPFPDSSESSDSPG